MNYTEKYHLPQWVKMDRIMMEDFNAAMASIEGGLAAAQNTADTAQAGAVEAAKLPYAVGSYTGSGGEQTIEVGFMPSIVLIFTSQNVTGEYKAIGRVFVAGRDINSGAVTMLENGFKLGANSYTSGQYPIFNRSYEEYQFIAFR